MNLISKTNNLFVKLFVFVFVLTAIMSVSSAALAQITNYNEIGNVNGPAHVTIRDILLGAISWSAGIVAVLAILVIIIAGFLWAIAGGDQDRVDTARRWVMGAVFGLIIALGAWAIVFVIVNYVIPADRVI